MSKNLMFVLPVLAVCFFYGEALTCYKCSSCTGNVASYTKEVCPPDQQRCVTTKVSLDLTNPVVQTVDLYTRGCYTTAESCSDQLNYAFNNLIPSSVAQRFSQVKPRFNCNYCYTDLCNA